MNISYQAGDATDPPPSDGPRVIVHVCNNVGAWGAGFTRAVSRRWSRPEWVYRATFKARADSETPLPLGSVQFVAVGDGILVANMIAQNGLRSPSRRVVIDYPALADCLTSVAEFCKERGASVHMPRIGCGLAGGEWGAVVKVIAGTLGMLDVPVTVYDFVAEECGE
jgi:O-acetyl-ADP-ribose deacetylase (regulator of RNase III)